MKVARREIELRVVLATVGAPDFVTFYLAEEEKKSGRSNGLRLLILIIEIK